MARTKNKAHTEIKEWKLYILLFPPQNDFYIGKTSQKNVYTTFKDHCILRYGITKDYIQKLKKDERVPEMYLLETVKDTEVNAFSKMLAWTNLLSQKGYKCVNGETFISYSEDLMPRSQEFYEEIKNQDVAEIIKTEKSLFPNYHFRQPQSKKKDNLIVNISFKPEEYEIMEKRAAELSMTKTAYCKHIILNGEIVNVTSFVSGEYLKELRTGITTMQQAIVTIYKLGQYFPSDLAKIEEFKNIVEEHYSKIIKESIKITNKITKREEK